MSYKNILSVQEKYASNSICFGCGPANKKGLRIKSFRNEEGLEMEFETSEEHQAFPGIINGGIIGTLIGIALIGIAFGAGFTLGPLIAYFGLALFNERPWGVGALASLLSLVALLLAVFVFQETRVPGRTAAKEFFSMSRTVSVLRMPAVGGLILIYFLAIFIAPSRIVSEVHIIHPREAIDISQID